MSCGKIVRWDLQRSRQKLNTFVTWKLNSPRWASVTWASALGLKMAIPAYMACALDNLSIHRKRNCSYYYPQPFDVAVQFLPNVSVSKANIQFILNANWQLCGFNNDCTDYISCNDKAGGGVSVRNEEVVRALWGLTVPPYGHTVKQNNNKR